jgi:penicillin-binding protein 2
MDTRSGAVLVSASAPRFNPNAFVSGDDMQLSALLTEDARPLFDRATKMSIPPGSLFKVVTALALLQSGAVDPDEPFHCQGYLHSPDRQRCFIFRRFGVGHGELTLADALAQSCNVYFYHFATQSGCGPLIDWAQRLGLGQATGIDLPDEAAGRLPTPDNIEQLEGHAWGLSDTQSLAIGQSSLAVTPLQMARLMAAIANGGTLLTPHVTQSGIGDESFQRAGKPCSIAPQASAVIREGLKRVVADPNGTAHAAFESLPVSVAGKTGTAETGRERRDHAWFAGYVPADSPRFAFAMALEHAGGGAAVAAPIARRLIERMIELGYFGAVEVVEHSFPPGKG